MFRWQKYENIMFWNIVMIAMLRWSKKCMNMSFFAAQDPCYDAQSGWQSTGQGWQHGSSMVPTSISNTLVHQFRRLPSFHIISAACKANELSTQGWLHDLTAQIEVGKDLERWLNYSRWPTRKYHAVTQSMLSRTGPVHNDRNCLPT